MSKFTKGPWSVGLTKATQLKTTIYAADGGSIANLGNARKRNHSEMEANARLLAAAPELLEACEILLDYVLEENGPNCRGAKEAITAIARVRGRD